MDVYYIRDKELELFGQKAVEYKWHADFIFDILYLSSKNDTTVLSISWDCKSQRWEISKNDESTSTFVPEGRLNFEALSLELPYLN